MTPRYPADPKFRRHPHRAMQGIFRAGMLVALIMAVGLSWSMWREKGAAPVPVVTEQAPVVEEKPMVVAKAAPPVARSAKPALPVLALPPQKEPVKPVAAPQPVKPVVVEAPLLEVKEAVREVQESREAAKPPKPAAPPEVKEAVKEEEEEKVDLTFYRVFQDRRVVLPQMVVAKGPTPVMAAMDTAHAEKAVVKPLVKPVPVAKAVEPAPVVAAAPPGNGFPWNWTDKSAEARAEPANWSRSRFMVQVSVSPEFEKAAAMASRLQRQGVNAQITRTSINGNAAYRVQVGPFTSREEATSKAQLWKVGGGAPVVIADSSG